MAISTGGGGEENPMSDINTTPLVDVMLVLLIVFLIAIPVAIQTVKLELPVVPFEPTKAKRENVLLSVTIAGQEAELSSGPLEFGAGQSITLGTGGDASAVTQGGETAPGDWTSMTVTFQNAGIADIPVLVSPPVVR